MAGGTEGLKAANGLVGQIITVSAALLAFTVTFAEKFTPTNQAINPPTSLKISWVLFALTILAGFWTQMATTGTLDVIDRGQPDPNPARTNIKIPAAIMIVLFVAATGFLIAAGWTLTKASVAQDSFRSIPSSGLPGSIVSSGRVDDVDFSHESKRLEASPGVEPG